MTASQSFRDYLQEKMPLLLRSARAVTGESQLAQDVLQAVLERACRGWRRISRLEHPDAYLKRMIFNEFVDQVRRQARQRPYPDVGSELVAPDDLGPHDDRLALLGRIRQLPPQQRAAVGLRYYAQLSDHEIADTLGCSAGAVRSYLSRAHATLRVTCAADYQTQEF